MSDFHVPITITNNFERADIKVIVGRNGNEQIL